MKRREGKTAILFILLLTFLTAKAQFERPELYCATVNSDGSVELTWNKVPPPATNFTAYSIYYSPQPATAFNLIETITDPVQNTYTHIAAAANDRSRFYYVVVESNAGPSSPSDTLETMFLYFETEDNENITLFWNAMFDPPASSTDLEYEVYMEYPPGTWELLGLTQDLAFDHHFWFCNKQQSVVNFQVINVDASHNCQSTSNISGEILSNLTQPDKPLMDSVSITPGGEPIVGWQPGQSPDISGYIIYRVTTINDSIDFVPGIGSSNYIDQGADPCQGPVKYAIASVDSCGNKSPGTFLEPHQTLYLEEIGYDPCYLVNTLSWNAYINFDPSLAGYEVYVSVNGAPFTLLATTGSSETGFVHDNLSPTTQYSYFVRAFTAGRTKSSTSCIQQMTTYNSPFPQFMYLRYVTVLEDNSLELSFLSDTTAHVNGYKVFRSENQSDFEEVGDISPSGSDIYFFTDQGAQPWLTSYYYRVSVIDSCFNESLIANTSRSILLQVEAGEDLVNTLTWNAYETWDADVAGYRIYRRLGEGNAEQEVGQTGPGELVFFDDVSSLSGTSGRISYYVEAFEGPGNQFGYEETARSNEVLADVKEKVFVPNAIAPKGFNNSLKPVGAFIGEENYQFSVYNRWGQVVFKTVNPSEAWNGKYQDKYVEQGIYVYILKFTSATGEIILRKGTVAVIF